MIAHLMNQQYCVKPVFKMEATKGTGMLEYNPVEETAIVEIQMQLIRKDFALIILEKLNLLLLTKNNKNTL
jgi:hypothetical protein